MKPRSPSLSRDVAHCLIKDFGIGPEAHKRVATLTGCMPGGVAHWFKGTTTVHGFNLVKLMAISPSVREMVDHRTGRADRLRDLKRRARRVLPIIRSLANMNVRDAPRGRDGR